MSGESSEYPDESATAALLETLQQNYCFGSTITTASTTKYIMPLSARKQHINNTIRFQVILCNIGKLDVATGSVPMTFRVSLFWEDRQRSKEERKRYYTT